MKRTLVVAVVIAGMSVGPASASDPLNSLRFLVGNWNCTYAAGKTHVNYKATFAYDLGNNWLRESDSWTGGGGDLGMFTYDPKRHNWTAVIVENERSAAIFRAKGANANHVVYHSIYPEADMTEVFDRTSPTRYVLHFTQTAHGHTKRSTDICVKR